MTIYLKESLWVDQAKRAFRHGPVLLCCTLVSILGGCQHDIRSAYEECLGFGIYGDERLYCEVSIIELLGNPDRLNGTDVFVGGLVLVDETAGELRLVPSIDQEWHLLPEAAIHLDISLEEAKRFLRPGRYQTVLGRFEWQVSLRNPYRRKITQITMPSWLREDKGA